MSRRTTAILLLLLAAAIRPADAGAPPLSVLFFFSFECPHCEKAMPRMERVSRKHPVRGIVLNPRPGDLPVKREKLGVTFPVAGGDNAVRDAYGIRGVPTAVIVGRNGEVREKLVGERAIQRIAELLESLEAGGAGVLEIRGNPGAFENREVAVTGWLERLGGWGVSRGTFFVTNGTEKIRVTPWHPVDAGKNPARGGEDAMTRYEERLVTIRGIARKSGDSVSIDARDGKLVRER